VVDEDIFAKSYSGQQYDSSRTPPADGFSTTHILLNLVGSDTSESG
jgi:hypothetical protein